MSAEKELVLERLSNQRHTVVSQWLACTLKDRDSCSSDSLQQDHDAFRNPVGHILEENLPVLFDALVENRSPATYRQNLDAIVRLRAVQDCSASDAVSFVFSLKEIIQRVMAGQSQFDPRGIGCAALEARIDAMALLAFDLYMSCREQIYEARLNESRRQFYVSNKLASKATGRSRDSR